MSSPGFFGFFTTRMSFINFMSRISTDFAELKGILGLFGFGRKVDQDTKLLSSVRVRER